MTDTEHILYADRDASGFVIWRCETCPGRFLGQEHHDERQNQ